MSFIEKYNCIFCKYKKYNTEDNPYRCFDVREKDEDGYPIDKCYSISNLYYGKLAQHFPFRQIDDVVTTIRYKKYDLYCKKMDEKYGDSSLETDEYKFIWGIKSWDDLSGCNVNMYTMNDIDLTYDKNSKQYMLGIETAYVFDSYESECKYLNRCLDAFTKYMESKKLDTNKRPLLFMSNLGTEMCANTIEDLYVNFKILVNGYCSFEE